MANWKKHKVYCARCRCWYSDLEHLSCSAGQSGSICWLDLESFNLGCNKCNTTWTLEDNTFNCTVCGNAQKTVYTDSVFALQRGDQVIASDGETVYVLTRTGTVVMGRRSFGLDGVED